MHCQKKYWLAAIVVGASWLFMSGCAYHPPVQQGNLLAEKDIKKITVGMTSKEVRSLLGEPLLMNIYANKQLVYIYTLRVQHKRPAEKRLIIYFKNQRVTRYQENFSSPPYP